MDFPIPTIINQLTKHFAWKVIIINENTKNNNSDTQNLLLSKNLFLSICLYTRALTSNFLFIWRKNFHKIQANKFAAKLVPSRTPNYFIIFLNFQEHKIIFIAITSGLSWANKKVLGFTRQSLNKHLAIIVPSLFGQGEHEPTITLNIFS